MSKNAVSVIIPNYNGLEHLKTCFDSLSSQNFPNFRVILVDNGSDDGSVLFTEKNYPHIEVIALKQNCGFAKAVNTGIEYAIEKHQCTLILLLNNDVELHQGFLAAAVDSLEKNPGAHILAVKMLNFYSRDIIDDTGNFITKKGGTPYPRGQGEKDTGKFDKPEFIFGACAGAAFYRTEVFKKIGLFDQDFFAYLEDVDFSFRAQLAGFKCYYEPRAVCYHKRGGSSVSTFRFQIKMNERNIIWLRFKDYPLLMYLYYQPLFCVSRIIRYVLLLKDNGFKTFISALNGYFAGWVGVLKQIPGRINVQRTKCVSNKYINSLFR